LITPRQGIDVDRGRTGREAEVADQIDQLESTVATERRETIWSHFKGNE
jgi:hypothetical protein